MRDGTQGASRLLTRAFSPELDVRQPVHGTPVQTANTRSEVTWGGASRRWGRSKGMTEGSVTGRLQFLTTRMGAM